MLLRILLFHALTVICAGEKASSRMTPDQVNRMLNRSPAELVHPLLPPAKTGGATASPVLSAGAC
jgi:hypothetical protein